MYDYHAIFATLGVLLGAVGVILYIRSIWQGITKPHIFTWLSYLVVDSIIVVIQFREGGGLGAWVTLANVFGIFLICILALTRGEKRIKITDWITFTAALVAVVLWQITSDPLVAVIILTVENVFGTAPTFRKSYLRPHQETITLWGLDIGMFALGIFALSSITWTTALYSTGIVLTNLALVAMILFRRRALDGPKALR